MNVRESLWETEPCAAEDTSARFVFERRGLEASGYTSDRQYGTAAYAVVAFVSGRTSAVPQKLYHDQTYEDHEDETAYASSFGGGRSAGDVSAN